MKLFISGYGKMGKMIEKIILSRNIEYAGWSEAVTETDPSLAKECVCIDFTTPAAFRENYKFLAENFKAVVVGTTGWADIREEVVAYFEKCGTPMIWATNFSVGVNVFFAVTDYITKLLHEFGGYSPYMVEMHHCHKLDAPSGTAITLAEGILENLDRKANWIMGDLTNPDGSVTEGVAPKENELKIDAIRRDEVPGIHSITYNSPADTITITHDAHNRSGFALGAVLAAEYVKDHDGMLGMGNLFDF